MGLDAAGEGSGKAGKCRCVEGLPVDCALSKADGSPLFKNRAVAAVCVIKVRSEGSGHTAVSRAAASGWWLSALRAVRPPVSERARDGATAREREREREFTVQ